MSAAPAASRWPLAQAAAQAQVLVTLLYPQCLRLEVAGSIRRRRPTVGDIELVLLPKVDDLPVPGQTSLFGTPRTRKVNRAWGLLDSETAAGRLPPPSKGGDRYRCYPAGLGLGPDGHPVVGSRLQVDVFSVADPRGWGAILAIRTGPAEFSKRCVEALRPRGLRMEDGLVWREGTREVVPMLEEADFFQACGMLWILPEARR